MQIAPAPILNHIVKHFLILEDDSSVLLRHRFSPDGHAGLVFYYREQSGQEASLHPRSFVYGQASRFHDLSSFGRIGMLVAVLQPYALYALTGIPAHLLTNQMVSTTDIFGAQARELEERLQLAASHHNRIRCLERFLINLKYAAAPVYRLSTAAVELVQRYQGLASVSHLSQELGITERHLERKFREDIGLSPKQFSRTIRFQRLLKRLQHNTEDSLTQTAYEAGYYDQSHFIREFKAMAGIPPKQYLRHSRLALNFMRLNG
jgi:AraC-like DNA-binding protein